MGTAVAAVLVLAGLGPAGASEADDPPPSSGPSLPAQTITEDSVPAGSFLVVGGTDGSVAIVPDADPADLAGLPGLSVLEIREDQTVLPFGAGAGGFRPDDISSDPWRDSQWSLDLYDLEALWSAAGTTGSGVVVAVIDSGVDATHPDLAGRVDAGWDFITDQPWPAGSSVDGCGHGTHVAGTIAAGADNGSSSTGLAPGVVIMPVRVLGGSSCVGSMSDVEAGIIWAADHGADVINLSLGAPAGDRAGALNAAVQHAVNNGAVVVAAAGNCGYHRTRSTCPNTKEGQAAIPAAYQDVLSVANVDPHLVASEISNRDAHVDVVAPGVAIMGPWPAEGTARLSGTSMAGPHVAGLVALTVAADSSVPTGPSRSTFIEDRVAAATIDLGVSGRDDTYGRGLVDAWSLVLPTRPAPAVSVTTTAVSWTPVPGASGYEVSVLDEVVGDDVVTSTVTTVGSSTTGISRFGDWTDGRLVFKVRALGVSAAPGIGVQPFPDQNLEVLPVDGGVVVKLAPTPEGYVRAWPTDTLDETAGVPVEDVHGNPMGLRFGGLTNGVARSFRAHEVYEGWSWTTTAPTQGPVTATPGAGLGVSGAVSGLTVEPSSSGALSVSWLPPTDLSGYPVTGYRVTHDGLSSGQVLVVSSSSPSVTLTGGPTSVTIQPWTEVGGGAPLTAHIPSSAGLVSPAVFSPGVVGPDGPMVIDLGTGQPVAIATSAPEPARLVAVHRKDDGSTWATDPEGRMYTTGTALHRGDLAALVLNEPVLGMTPTADGSGYWMVASDGGVFAFDVPFLGSMGGTPLNRPITAMAVTPTGLGYHLVASDGGVFSFGDARFLGSLAGVALNQPINGMAVTPSGNGYWMVASDGGVFAFGDAAYHGSVGGLALDAPVMGLMSTESGQGYWLVDALGRSYPFGDAP
ncbi:MAG: S8 family serine peptidase [Actinomycetia bacterium]|nr:S8 family serine peptidase [Actinomycetes bacterium]